MFSICTAYIENGKINETLKESAEAEKRFTKDIGVLFRKFFQCQIQPHIIWSITEWEREKSHNDAAQSIMKIRRDDRFASIAFGPEPYFEIFCNEDKSVKIGNYSGKNEFVVVIHGLIGEKVKDGYLKLRDARIAEQKDRFQWLSVFHNRYNSHEFVAYMGFLNEDEFNKLRKINELYLEEYIFTGLNIPLGMSKIANYNQFICKPIIF